MEFADGGDLEVYLFFMTEIDNEEEENVDMG